jgi:hypothetical protein
MAPEASTWGTGSSAGGLGGGRIGPLRFSIRIRSEDESEIGIGMTTGCRQIEIHDLNPRRGIRRKRTTRQIGDGIVSVSRQVDDDTCLYARCNVGWRFRWCGRSRSDCLVQLDLKEADRCTRMAGDSLAPDGT